MDENKERNDAPEKALKSAKKTRRKLSPQLKENQYTKGSEKARENGRKGGIKSGESKRNKKDARESIRYMLQLSAKKGWEANLKEFGVATEELTNMNALSARLFSMALSGNLDAYLTLMKMGGYDPEEIRRERESIASDARRDKEVNAKVEALGNGPDGSSAALNMNDEEGHSDVVIYMPQVEKFEDLEGKDQEGGKTEE